MTGPNLTLQGDYKIAYREACDYIAESLERKINELTDYIIPDEIVYSDDDDDYDDGEEGVTGKTSADFDDYDDDKIESGARSILEDLDLDEVRRADDLDGTESLNRY